MVAGLLREHQFEMAFEQLTLMERKDIPIENWLHSMMIYQLCDFQEFDEVYRLMLARNEQGHDMTLALWTHVLNTASHAQHMVTIRYVWRRMVELGYLHPSEETRNNVLALAARLGDIEQAESVFRFLADQEIAPRLQDFEHRMEAHVNAGDLSTAFHVLCTMQDVGITPGENSLKPILTYMIESKIDRREAWQMLKHLQNANNNIPLDAVQVIAELCEHHAREDPTVVDDAVGFYRELYSLCPGGANVQVYNTLIRMCRIARNREAGMFLVREMASLGVIPNATTFEAIVLMCLDANNYQSAYMYFQDMLKRDATVSPQAAREIQELCGKSVNEFAMRLQYHPQIKAQSQVEEAKADHSISEQETGASTVEGKHTGEATQEKPKFARTDLVRAARLAYNRDRRRRKRQRLAMEGKARKPDGQDSGQGQPEQG